MGQGSALGAVEVTPAKLMTNRFMVRCGELWPDTIRLEETGVGDGTPTTYVNQAIALLEERGDATRANELRQKLNQK